MTEQEQPDWYGKHDNPHHAGLISHLKKIESANDEVYDITGKKGKHISPVGIIFTSEEHTSELLQGIEP